MLWWVAAHAGPTEATAVVHVMTNDVDVMVDGRSIHVDNWWETAPIECTLREGSHTLGMKRGEDLLYEESFHVRGGEDMVLVACLRRPAHALGKQNSP